MDGFSVNAGSFPAYFGDLVLGSARPGAAVLDRLVVRLLEEEAHEQEGHWPCRGCGVLLSSNDDSSKPCEACQRKRDVPVQTVALGGYAGGLGALIAAAKYGRWALPLEILGARLGVELLMQLTRSGKPLVVAMPSPQLRRLHRGLDHTAVLAAGVNRITGWPVQRGLWRSWVSTQVGSSRSRREKGGRGFHARSRFKKALLGREVVLIDDVRTSGVSLEKASRLCHRLGAVQVSAGIVAAKRGEMTNEGGL